MGTTVVDFYDCGITTVCGERRETREEIIVPIPRSVVEAGGRDQDGFVAGNGDVDKRDENNPYESDEKERRCKITQCDIAMEDT